MNKTLLVIFVLISSISFMGSSLADTNTKNISIELSESCITLVKLNDTNTCSSEYFIKTLYPELAFKPNYKKLIDEAQKTERTSYQVNNALLNHQIACVKTGVCNIFELTENQKVIYWYSPDQKIRPYIDITIKIEPNILHTNMINDYTTNEIRNNANLIKEYSSEQSDKVNRINVLDKLIELEMDINRTNTKSIVEYQKEKQELLQDIKSLNTKIKELAIDSNPIVETPTSREITFNVNKLHIDQSCRNATLKTDQIWRELGFIIYYMVENCQDDQILGKLKDNYHEPINKHELDITTSPNWQAQQKLKEDMEKCKEKC